MYKFEIHKDGRMQKSHHLAESNVKAKYFVHMNFSMTDELADRINLVEGIHSTDFWRYSFNFFIARFFGLLKVRNAVIKILEDHVKRLNKPIEKTKKKKVKITKKTRIEIINKKEKRNERPRIIGKKD